MSEAPRWCIGEGTEWKRLVLWFYVCLTNLFSYSTHIFDQADEWATHVAFMQLNRTLSPVHRLATHEPYQNILNRSGKDRAFCPMYTLVLEELERQYKEQTDLFADDNQCLADVIMEHQGQELGGDRHEQEAEGDQTGWVSGRLTRQLNAAENEDKRKERKEMRLSSQGNTE